jgi:hypothetical protein
VRKQIAVLVVLMGVPGVVRASPGLACFPSGNTVSPACVSLVGSAGGVPAHSFGQFQVVVRDLANNPCPGATVVVDLSACPDLHLCADQGDPDAIVNCAAKTVRKLAAADGRVNFTLLGGSDGTGNAEELLSAGRIYANGVLIGSPTVSAFDLDGVNGLGINDLSAWIVDFGTALNPAFGRSDYDCSGTVGINDMSIWLSAFGSGAQIESCGATCP